MSTFAESEDLPFKYIVGIDLGTTNSAVAYLDRTGEDSRQKEIHFLSMPQLVASGELGYRLILPSFLYLPGSYELPSGTTALPWDPARDYAVGEFAREQGALVPGRLVSSAKSWLCHGGVDRTAPILPWGAGAEVLKISPVEASTRYLKAMKEAWNETIGRGREGFSMENQMVILTVPASFDEVARELTVSAAHNAGLPRIVLQEEPLAAFYAWLSAHENDWLEKMSPGQVILVCDVGGGTTDFTIVAIREGETGLRFDRLAVGDHLMLGGDNMDLSLARFLEIQLLGQPGRLDSKRWHRLWHECRKAKEALLGGELPVPSPSASSTASQFGPRAGQPIAPTDSVVITIVGTGRKLIADTLKGTLTRSQVEEMILDGFFPFVPLDDTPKSGVRTGLSEWGLPYVQDPAITRHLAAFWQRHRTLVREETGRSDLYPDFILFNGGALTPASIRERILSVVQSWFQSEAGEGWSPIELPSPHPELAVAVGAAYYGRVRLGEGVRIGAGSPRAYYVQVARDAQESETEGEQTGVCLIPRGAEEGFEARLEKPAFQVLTNQAVEFQIFSSSTRLGDHLGDVISLSASEITSLPPIRTALRYGKKGAVQALPVQIFTRLTEIGTLELWCHSLASPHRWQLQFDVRSEKPLSEQPPAPSGETLDANVVEKAQEKIRAAFRGGESVLSHPPERLVRDLTSLLELGKEKWPTPLIRKLADTLLESKHGNHPTPQHEARWFNLLGYCLRPGFGDPVDEWRFKEVWKLYPLGLQFPRQPQGRLEWWIFWRRVAGGLSSGQQWHIYQQVAPGLPASDKKKKKPAKKGLKSAGAQEDMEVWMTLATFERLPAAAKVELGRILLERVRKGKAKLQEFWAISRLGARIPFYGPLDQVIPNEEAAAWVSEMLSLKLPPTEALAYALVQLARFTGDRERDVSLEERNRLTPWLEKLPQGLRLAELLTLPEAALMSQEKDWIFGESLPAGLILSNP